MCVVAYTVQFSRYRQASNVEYVRVSSSSRSPKNFRRRASDIIQRRVRTCPWGPNLGKSSSLEPRSISGENLSWSIFNMLFFIYAYNWLLKLSVAKVTVAHHSILLFFPDAPITRMRTIS